MAKNMGGGYRNIVVVGMPGSGKSTFAKSYAHHTRRSFLDFDRYVERAAGKTIPQIFAEDGEEAFRALEQKCLRKMERRQHHVIALGGGTPCSTENLEIARSLGVVVFLEASPEVLAGRIFLEKETRPLFAAMQSVEETLARVNELWDGRKSWYEQADIFLQTEFSSIDNLKLQLGVLEQRAFSRDYQREMTAITGEDSHAAAAQRRLAPLEKIQPEAHGEGQNPSAPLLDEHEHHLSAEEKPVSARFNPSPHSQARPSANLFLEVFALEDAAGVDSKFGYGKTDRPRLPRNENRPRRNREPSEAHAPSHRAQTRTGSGYVPRAPSLQEPAPFSEQNSQGDDRSQVKRFTPSDQAAQQHQEPQREQTAHRGLHRRGSHATPGPGQIPRNPMGSRGGYARDGQSRGPARGEGQPASFSNQARQPRPLRRQEGPGPERAQKEGQPERLPELQRDGRRQSQREGGYRPHPRAETPESSGSPAFTPPSEPRSNVREPFAAGSTRQGPSGSRQGQSRPGSSRPGQSRQNQSRQSGYRPSSANPDSPRPDSSQSAPSPSGPVVPAFPKKRDPESGT